MVAIRQFSIFRVVLGAKERLFSNKLKVVIRDHKRIKVLLSNGMIHYYGLIRYSKVIKNKILYSIIGIESLFYIVMVRVIRVTEKNQLFSITIHYISEDIIIQ